MAKNSFIRFAETLMIKKEMRVVSITVRLMITDCTGTIYFTDLQFQEGDQLTGYTVHTSKMLAKCRKTDSQFRPGIITVWCVAETVFYSTWVKLPQVLTVYLSYTGYGCR